MVEAQLSHAMHTQCIGWVSLEGGGSQWWAPSAELQDPPQHGWTMALWKSHPEADCFEKTEEYSTLVTFSYLITSQDVLTGTRTFQEVQNQCSFNANECQLTQSRGWQWRCSAPPDTCHSSAVKGSKGQNTVSKPKGEIRFSTQIELDRNHHHK